MNTSNMCPIIRYHSISEANKNQQQFKQRTTNNEQMNEL